MKMSTFLVFFIIWTYAANTHIERFVFN